jgi:hypothetical protein
MQAIAHGTKVPGLGGPPKEVAKEFVDKTSSDKRKKFAKAIMKERRG